MCNPQQAPATNLPGPFIQKPFEPAAGCKPAFRSRPPTNSNLQLRFATPSLRDVNDSLPPCAAEACPQPDLCPLNRVKAGTSVRIKQLSASPEVSHRLREMGFCEEQQIRVVSKQVNVICQVCHARLGLSQQLAEAILVELLPPARDLQVA